MITAKLSSFTPEEVDEFLEIVAKSQTNLYEKVDCENQVCQYCKWRHLCADLHELSIYLSDEIMENYPHVKSSARYLK